MSEKLLHKNEFLPLILKELREFNTTIHIFNEGVATNLHINATDLRCRDLLNQTGPMTAGQLAKHTNLTTGAITGVIDRLEKAELVERMQDPNDRRCVIIQPLTHRNSEIIQLFKPLRDSLSQLFKKYSEEELNLILDILVQLNLLFSTETMNLKSTE